MTAPLSPETIDRLAEGNILCLGDVMLDRYIYGQVERISPEAPIPVFNIERETVMLGGAGNVVRNLSALGASTTAVLVIGDDVVGKQIATLLGDTPRVTPYLIAEKGRASTKKTRYVAAGQQVMRSDSETTAALHPNTESQILRLLREEIPSHDLVLLSDYGKGALSDAIIKEAMECARTHGKPVIVDPKSRDLSRYRGAHTVSPNLKEITEASGRALKDEIAIVDAARETLRNCGVDHVLVTRGKDGMTLVSSHGNVHHIRATAREVYDVSGAGDTAIATYGAALAAGITPPEAAQLANLAAGIVVGKTGTAAIYRTDLKTALHTHGADISRSKILPLANALERLKEWRADGHAIGFTNGCFDIMHAGHLALLHDAKSRCGKLVVAVNSDASVKRLKGETRPVNAEMDRAMLLASLAAVDMVVIFREDTPMELLKAMRPDLLIKGADYTKEQVVGWEFVESYGGKVALIPLKAGYSTTSIIQKTA